MIYNIWHIHPNFHLRNTKNRWGSDISYYFCLGWVSISYFLLFIILKSHLKSQKWGPPRRNVANRSQKSSEKYKIRTTSTQRFKSQSKVIWKVKNDDHLDATFEIAVKSHLKSEKSTSHRRNVANRSQTCMNIYEKTWIFTKWAHI